MGEASMARTLQFTGQHSASVGWKVAMLSGFAVAIAASGWLMFARTEASREGHLARRVVVIACAIVYTARVAITLFVFLRRKIVWWEGLVGSVWFPILLFLFVYVGGIHDEPMGNVDALGIALYLLGSYLGTASELTRHTWKHRLQNEGHLYTQGLFKYARHINYLGDVVLFSGFALVTHEPWMLIVPLAMTLSFVLIWIPAHDVYLEGRYGDEVREYAQQTKKLIPLVY